MREPTGQFLRVAESILDHSDRVQLYEIAMMTLERIDSHYDLLDVKEYADTLIEKKVGEHIWI